MAREIFWTPETSLCLGSSIKMAREYWRCLVKKLQYIYSQTETLMESTNWQRAAKISKPLEPGSLHCWSFVQYFMDLPSSVMQSAFSQRDVTCICRTQRIAIKTSPIGIPTVYLQQMAGQSILQTWKICLMTTATAPASRCPPIP